MEELLKKLMELNKEAEELDKSVTEFLESRNGRIEGVEDFIKMNAFRAQLARIEADRAVIYQNYNKAKELLGWKR